MSLDIFLTNNLTNKKEKFIPQDEKNVRMYVCGPTVYDDPHIGNARPLVIFDILFRILKNEYHEKYSFLFICKVWSDKMGNASQIGLERRNLKVSASK